MRDRRDIIALALVKCTLYEAGERRRRVSSAVLESRLFHDLGMYGDIAEAYLEFLREQYEVSTDNFHFDDYFPQEFIGKNWLERILFWIWPVDRKKFNASLFLPLTLRDVATAIEEGHWSESVIRGIVEGGRK